MSKNRCTTAALAALLLLSPAISGDALAQQAAKPVREVVLRYLEQESAGLAGRVEIEVGPVDPDNRLPACAELLPFFPAGTRAWGQISVGVRCESPVTWTIYVPARVAVMTEYLVTARPIRPGQIVAHADLKRRFGDLAAEPPDTLTDLAQAVGQRARHAVAPGHTLRANMLRLPPAVRQGQTVRIVVSGGGFSASNEGRALNAAAEGEPVRVRLKNGQVVSGTARAGGTVDVRF